MFQVLKSIAFYILPVVLGYLTVIAVNETERFATDGGSGRIHSENLSPTKCNWACHDDRQHCFGPPSPSPGSHNGHLYGLPKGIKKMVRGPVEWMMDKLGAKKAENKSHYRLANILLLAILWPLLLSIMIMHIAKRFESMQRIRHSMIPIALIGLDALLSVCILQFRGTSNPDDYLYEYLTDFILTLSHWSGLTYYDVNALLFIIMMPLLSVVLPGILVYERLQTQHPS
jgi:hypothetical protein